ncbi:MAG: GIY-YIG nuclease family protein [Pseudomonadales bacterium]|nr:GIY-YIG nuclease family protein [Pseudomonadales bacterium]
MSWVYILCSKKDNSYYVGSTNNLERRIGQHNNGFSRYTRAKIPWKLVYTETHDSLKDARIREQQLKNWKSRVALERLIGKNKQL